MDGQIFTLYIDDRENGTDRSRTNRDVHFVYLYRDQQHYLPGLVLNRVAKSAEPAVRPEVLLPSKSSKLCNLPDLPLLFNRKVGVHESQSRNPEPKSLHLQSKSLCNMAV